MTSSQHVYEVRPRRDKPGFDLILLDTKPIMGIRKPIAFLAYKQKWPPKKDGHSCVEKLFNRLTY